MTGTYAIFKSLINPFLPTVEFFALKLIILIFYWRYSGKATVFLAGYFFLAGKWARYSGRWRENGDGIVGGGGIVEAV